MKITFRLFCLLPAFAAGLHCATKTLSPSEQIAELNARREAAFASKNVKELVSMYSKDAVYMPEYHPTLFDRSSIETYFTKWMTAIRSSTYRSVTSELLEQGNDLFETGTFTDTTIRTINDTVISRGKYFRHWKLDPANVPTIYAEIWGGRFWYDRSKSPFAGNGDPVSIKPYATGSEEEKQVISRNELLGQLVKERKGLEHADLFTDDAVYMPYYESAIKGINKIREYFYGHEKPGEVTVDSISLVTGRVTAINDLVMEHGFYGVKWTARDGTSGVVTGKSLNLWKRKSDGTLMMYRQMVNHN
jgi:ketosteroid isomerase-like protein